MIKFKKNGLRKRVTLNGKEISDILAAHVIKPEVGFRQASFNVEMKTTTTQEAVFIELDIREIEQEESA